MFSIPYRSIAYEPFWGKVTAHANFCEEDYMVTPYIAEVVSTLTSFSYVYYAYRGIKCNGNHKDAFLRNMPYLGLAAVGILSAIFHATLKQYTQYFDDLSMHIANTTVLHRAYTFDKSIKETLVSGVILAVTMSVFATYHCWTDEFILHSLIFGAMIVAVGVKTRSLIATRVKSSSIRKQVHNLVTLGAITFVGGFVLWNLDNMMCSSWRSFRRTIGMPWAFLFELHGWWHVLTCVGAYTFMALVEYLTSEEAGEPLGGNLAWPLCNIVNSDAGKIEESNVNGNGNGYSNGNSNGKSSDGTMSNGKTE